MSLSVNHPFVCLLLTFICVFSFVSPVFSVVSIVDEVCLLYCNLRDWGFVYHTLGVYDCL